MWLTIITCAIFAFSFSSGQSRKQPRLFDCIPTYRSCTGQDNACPRSHPVCSLGRCCRLPNFPFPSFCPSDRRGPRCGYRQPPCKPGYTCRRGYCCRDRISKCPAGMSTGPICRRGLRCPKGYRCINGRCCRKRIDVPVCPPFFAGPPCSKRISCKDGYTCIRGKCCRDLIPPRRCPNNMLYTGRCFGKKKCRFGSTCIDGACCRSKIIFPPIDPIERCPPPRPDLICPAVVLPPKCFSDSDCGRFKKCCKVGCAPRDCVPAISFPPFPRRKPGM